MLSVFPASIIGTMHDSDMDVWRAIDHGERPIDWAAFIGHPDGADYLTQAGKDLMSQAADEEDSIEKLPVTPGPIVPAREQLGDLLLEQGHPDLA